MPAAALPGLAAMLLFLALHAALWRALAAERRSLALFLALAAASYAGVGLAWGPAGGAGWSVHFWTSAPVFLLLLILYMHLYVGVQRSVSVRLLEELGRAKEGRLRLEELGTVYPQEYMMRHRVDLMVETGWLDRTGTEYRCTAKGRLLARAALLMRRVYGADVTG